MRILLWRNDTHIALKLKGFGGCELNEGGPPPNNTHDSSAVTNSHFLFEAVISQQHVPSPAVRSPRGTLRIAVVVKAVLLLHIFTFFCSAELSCEIEKSIAVVIGCFTSCSHS